MSRFGKLNEMKSRARRRRKCKKKIRYSSYDQAQKAVWQGMVVYECEFSNRKQPHWHIGHISLHPYRHR